MFEKRKASGWTISIIFIVVIVAAAAIIILVWYSGSFGKVRESTGSCESGFSSFGEPRACYEGSACPAGKKKVVGLLSRCPEGKVCCEGTIQEGEAKASAGVIEVRYGSDDDTNKMLNKRTYNLNNEKSHKIYFWGTGDIKKCSATVWCRESGCKIGQDREKDKTKCDEDTHPFIDYTFGQLGKTYELDIIGYDKDDEPIASTKININAVEGEGDFAPGAEEEKDFLFNLYYTDKDNQVKELEPEENVVYETNKESMGFDLNCEGCTLSIKGSLGKEEVFFPQSYPRYELAEGINILTINNKEDKTLAEYYIKYTTTK